MRVPLLRGVAAVLTALAVIAIFSASLPCQDLQWARRDGGGLQEAGRQVAVDSDGSVIVLGEYFGTPTFGAGETDETTLSAHSNWWDQYLARYNPDGTLDWAVRIEGDTGFFLFSGMPFDLDVADDGSIYVSLNANYVPMTFTGTHGNTQTITLTNYNTAVVAKYDRLGRFAWARAIQGPAGTGARSYAGGVIALSDRSVVVHGTFSRTVDLGAGTTTLTAAPSQNYQNAFIVRYDHNGQPLWAQQVQGYTEARHVGVADDDSIVVEGVYNTYSSAYHAVFAAGTAGETKLSPPPGTNRVNYLASYSPDGTLQWARNSSYSSSIYHFIGGGSDLAVHPDGSISLGITTYAGGAVFGPGQPNETSFTTSGAFVAHPATARFDGNGNLLWAWMDTTDGNSYLMGLAAHTDGKTSLCGYSRNQIVLASGTPQQTTLISDGRGNPYLARFDATGVPEWATMYPGGGYEIAHDVDLGAGDALAGTGRFQYGLTVAPGTDQETFLSSIGGRSYDAFTFKYEGEAVGVGNLPDITRECDSGHNSATVYFEVEVTGNPPSTATLTVYDITNNRTLLSQAATAGTVGVGPVSFPLGSSTVRVSVSDGGIELQSSLFNVTVEDTADPVLVLPSAVTVECQAPQTPLFRTLVGVSATDGCDPNPLISFSPSSVPLGTTTVTATARDHTGNTTQGTFDVTVVDTTAPYWTELPEDIQRECADPSGTGVSFTIAAEDACGQVTITCTDQNGNTVDPAGTVFADGLHTVTCVASDPSGNSRTHTFTIEIVDNTAPVVVCPSDITVGNDPGQCYGTVTFQVTVTDQCDPNIQPVITDELGNTVQSGDAFPMGTTKLTVTATDKAGNTAQCSFNISVEDVEAPVITRDPAAGPVVTDCAGSPITVTAGDMGITATDNCDPAPQLVCSPTLLYPGDNTVVCTSTDAAGNPSSFTAQVQVLKGPFDWQLLRPLDPLVDNKIRAGQTVPVKIGLSLQRHAGDRGHGHPRHHRAAGPPGHGGRQRGRRGQRPEQRQRPDHASGRRHLHLQPVDAGLGRHLRRPPPAAAPYPEDRARRHPLRGVVH